MVIEGKTVLITGASRGIGRETAILMAKGGAKVAVNYVKHEEEAGEVKKELKKLGAEVMLIQGDVADEMQCRSMVKKVVDNFGSIDVLVNNAGIISWKPMEEERLRRLHRILDVNVKGMVNMTYETVKVMKEQSDGGVIVNIASGAGKTAYPNLAVYSASKFAVMGFTKAVAPEVVDDNIRVYAVCPGMTATDMTGGSGMAPEKVAERIIETAVEELDLSPGE